MFALRHPWLVVLVSGLIVGSVVRFNGSADRTALIVAMLMFALQAILWFPRYGPMRRYTERLLATHGDAKHE